MAPPDTEALQEAPEDAMRRVAREEARAVYDELTATDADGESWSLQRLMNRFGLSRRQALKALGLIAIGYGGTQAAARALIGTAEADAIGQVGTQADPVTKAWAHAVGAGDGAAAVGFDDAVTFDHEAISSATTIGDTTYVYLDSGIASFTATIPASLEARGGYVVFIDEAANLSTNSVDIASANWTVDGVASSTFDADQAAYALRANPNQSDWTSRIFTERLDAGTIATDEVVTDLIGKESVGGAVRYASENHSDLPGFQAAVDAADAGDTVVLLPGTHQISSTQTVNERLNLIFYGELSNQPGTVSPVFLLDTGGAGTTMYHMANPFNRWIYGNDPDWNTTGTIVGAEYRASFRSYGHPKVSQCGGIGHYINGSGTNNVNGIIAGMSAGLSEGDPGEGIRVEGPSDANAIQLSIDRIADCNTGYRQMRGIGNQIRIGIIEACTVGIEWGYEQSEGSTYSEENIAWVGDIETTTGILHNYYSTRNTVVYGSENTTTLQDFSSSNGTRNSTVSFADFANFIKRQGGHQLNDAILEGNGAGIQVDTPDGTATYRVRVDNNGNVVTDGPL